MFIYKIDIKKKNVIDKVINEKRRIVFFEQFLYKKKKSLNMININFLNYNIM